MSNYSTPTVSFADRQDFRPRFADPFRVMMTYRTKQSVPWSSDRRGFFVDPRDVRLMSSWLRGKL